MRPKVLAPRRILIAILLAATFGSASVYALGGEASTTADVPASWSIAAPAQGDAGEYEYALLDQASGQVVGQPLPYLRFQQRNTTTELDVAGDPIVVDTLEVTPAGYQQAHAQDGLTLSWGYGSSWLLARTTNGSSPYLDIGLGDLFDGGKDLGGPSVAGIPVPVMATRAENGTFRMRLYPSADDLLPLSALAGFLSTCGLRNAFQGQDVAVDGSFPFVVEECMLRLGEADPEEPTLTLDGDDEGRTQQFAAVFGRGFTMTYDAGSGFRALGVQQLAGEEALVIERTEGRPVRFWLVRDTPYPVQVAYDAGDEVHVVRLVSFERGEGTLGLGAAPRAPAPQPVLAPAQAWGLDDAGSGLIVPPSRAWQAALDDGPLADYLAQHPAAITHEVAGTIHETQQSHDQAWSFQLTDQGVGFQVAVLARVPTYAAVPAALGLPPLVEPVRGEPEFTFEYPAPEEPPMLDRSAMPATLPTAASMLARWQAYHPGSALPLWRFSMRCAEAPSDDGEGPRDCTRWVPVIGIDQSGTETGPYELQQDEVPPSLANEVRLVTQASDWDATGRIITTLEMAFDLSTSYGAQPLMPSATRDGYVPPPGGDGHWGLPPAATVAGIGAIAALLGIVYLLWPLAKGGVLAGYARVTGHEVLEHPLRQRIVGVVEATPGIHLKEIARQTGLAWGQTQHHVAKLVQAGALVAKATPGYTCYFPKGQDRHVMAAAHVLKADGARRLLQHIAGTTGLSMGQLSRAAGLTESTAHYHLKKLEAAGLVSTQLVGGARRVTLTALGAEAGRRYGGAAAAVAAS